MVCRLRHPVRDRVRGVERQPAQARFGGDGLLDGGGRAGGGRPRTATGGSPTTRGTRRSSWRAWRAAASSCGSDRAGGGCACRSRPRGWCSRLPAARSRSPRPSHHPTSSTRLTRSTRTRPRQARPGWTRQPSTSWHQPRLQDHRPRRLRLPQPRQPTPPHLLRRHPTRTWMPQPRSTSINRYRSGSATVEISSSSRQPCQVYSRTSRCRRAYRHRQGSPSDQA